MKKILTLLLFVTSIAQAQYSIKGAMTPPEKDNWVILYKVEGSKQKYINQGTIKVEEIEINGKKQKLGRFEFTLPKDAKPGAYRATYRDRGAGFIDFLFNKEDVEMVFNPQYPDHSVVFTKSLENKVYREYQDALNLMQGKLDALQEDYIKTKAKSTKKAYKKAFNELEDTQELYEKKSKGMLANHFIKASKPNNSNSVKDSTKEYLENIVNNFFNNINFKSNELYNSPFLVDKITDYIFYLRVANDQPTQQKIYNETISNVLAKLPSDNLKKEILEYLITRFTYLRNAEIVDSLFANYYDKLPTNLQNKEFKNEKLGVLTAAIGRTAPDFSWKEDNKSYKLSTLNDGENYLLVFWSTQCPHCTKEVPELYKFMENYKTTSVVAFALEMDDIAFSSWAKNKLYKWHNAIGTHPENKYDNETVRKYNLLGTPTYFVLDKNKKIIAMPDGIEQVKQYFEKK